MSLFGGSKSSRNTTNQDNRIINDYGNADLSQDNSVRNTTDNSIAGEYAGNTGTITVTDGNAINSAHELALAGLAMGENSFGLVDQGFNFALEAIGVNSGLVGDVVEAVDMQGDRNLAAAMRVSELGFEQNRASNELAMDLFNVSQNAAYAQQQDNNAALANGYQSSMQFVEGFSRSDGNALAQTNMKTIGFLMGGLVLSVLAYKAVK